MSDAAARAAEELRRRAALARRTRERSAADLRAKAEHVVRAKLRPDVRAWLIGSLAWGGFGERSDVDVVLEGATDEEATGLDLALALELRIPADVLRIEELDESFAARVRREGARIDDG